MYYDYHTVGPPDASHVNSRSYGQVVLFVADTDNHRIRRIDCVDGRGVDALGDPCVPHVSCWAGRCGNGTFSFTATHRPAPPQPGLADGFADVARFDSPRGLDAAPDGTVYVADTNNHLIRVVNGSRWVFTLAGTVRSFQEEEHPSNYDDNEGGGGNNNNNNNNKEPLPGCPPPCVKGVAGSRDGNLTSAMFSYPADVSVGYNQFNDSYSNQRRVTTAHGGGAANDVNGVGGGNWSLLVVDDQRVRRVTFPAAYASLFFGRMSRFKLRDNDPSTPLNEPYGDPTLYVGGHPRDHQPSPEDAVATTNGHAVLHGIRSAGRVSTVAGQAFAGSEDGEGRES